MRRSAARDRAEHVLQRAAQRLLVRDRDLVQPARLGQLRLQLRDVLGVARPQIPRLLFEPGDLRRGALSFVVVVVFMGSSLTVV